jgi:hypothetical protein
MAHLFFLAAGAAVLRHGALMSWVGAPITPARGKCFGRPFLACRGTVRQVTFICENRAGSVRQDDHEGAPAGKACARFTRADQEIVISPHRVSTPDYRAIDKADTFGGFVRQQGGVRAGGVPVARYLRRDP